ncbi:MAG: hypothetical protein Q9174_006129 [Haloplaca sp. 1 TL-2023]
MSSGKQVRFVYESFRHMQPGIPLLHLHGRQKQTARLDITSNFSATKNTCLLATDVVARGLDFPAVDWVIQLDCPEDADTYIHRVGRTARYERNGRAVLFLDPSEEEGMLKRLEQKKVTLEKINVRQKKQQDVQHQMQNMCFKDPELKYLGQKAFMSYVKSIHLQKDKEVFKLDQLPLEEFSASLGLPGAPKIKFLGGENTKGLKNAPRMVESSSSDEGEGNATNVAVQKSAPVRTKYDRMFERQNQDILSAHYSKLIDDHVDKGTGKPSNTNGRIEADDEQGFLSVKRRISASPSPDPTSDQHDQDATNEKTRAKPRKDTLELGANPLTIDSNRKRRLLASKKKLLKYRPRSHKIVFDAEGNPHEVYEFEDEEQFKARGPAEDQREEFVRKEGERLKEEEIADKDLAKRKRREKREKAKRREKEERMQSEGAGVELVPYDDDGEAAGSGMDKVQDDEDNEVGSDQEDKRREKKREKKWFEQEGQVKKRKRELERGEAPAAPETLDALETMALGLLA